MLNYKILTISEEIAKQEVIIHPVIFFNDSELILCDTGYPNQIDKINEELNKAGFSIMDITKIVITHHDHDHIGSLRNLKDKNPNIQIITSEAEAIFIRGDREPFRLTQAREHNKTLSGDALQFGIQFENYLKTIENCVVDRLVREDEYLINGLRVVMTPGHTEGHLSLFLEEEKLLILGDLLAIEDGKLIIPYPEFAFNLKLVQESLKRIKKLSPQKFICYHGGLIEGDLENLLV